MVLFGSGQVHVSPSTAAGILFIKTFAAPVATIVPGPCTFPGGGGCGLRHICESLFLAAGLDGITYGFKSIFVPLIVTPDDDNSIELESLTLIVIFLLFPSTSIDGASLVPLLDIFFALSLSSKINCIPPLATKPFLGFASE